MLKDEEKDFMKRKAAILITTLMMLTFAAGCSGPADTGKTDSQEPAAEEMENETEEESIVNDDTVVEYRTFEYDRIKLDVPSSWKQKPVEAYKDGNYRVVFDISNDEKENFSIFLNLDPSIDDLCDEKFFANNVPMNVYILESEWVADYRYKAYHNLVEFTRESTAFGMVRDSRYFLFDGDTKYVSLSLCCTPENMEYYSDIYDHVCESLDMEGLISEYGPALGDEPKEADVESEGENKDQKSQADTFVSVGAPTPLGGFMDFRKTDFMVTIPDNKPSAYLPDMTEGSVHFSARDHEMESCEATILYESDSKAIHQIKVLAPDETTLRSDKFRELIATIIFKMGITDMEDAAQMVDSAYEAEEPIVVNETYLHMNTTGVGFMVKY